MTKLFVSDKIVKAQGRAKAFGCSILPLFAIAVALSPRELRAIQSRDKTSSIIEIEIKTLIQSPDPVSGMKSTQTVKVNFGTKKITQSYKTGNTYGISSVRNDFKVSSVRFNLDKATFTVTGQTASGVQVMPDIDYELDFEVQEDGRTTITSGCHDGYPAYVVKSQGRNLYSFNHKPIRLYKLFGDCDVSVPRRTLGPL